MAGRMLIEILNKVKLIVEGYSKFVNNWGATLKEVKDKCAILIRRASFAL